MYALKNIKSFKGHEGEPCYQGALHGPAGKVGNWSDDSWGGAMRIDFANKAEEDKFVAWAHTYLPTLQSFDGKPYDPATMTRWDIIEMAVSEMNCQVQEDKQLQAAVKKGIAYYLPDTRSSDGKTLYAVNAPYTPENVAALRKRHPELLEIVNERFKMPFVDAAAFKQAEEDKRLKRMCKSSTLFTVRDASGVLKTMQSKLPFSAALKASLQARYPNLVEILNERYA